MGSIVSTRQEPAVLIGTVGTLVSAALAYWLAGGDVETVGQAVAAVLVAAAPVVAGAVTRGFVWSRASHERALADAHGSGGVELR